LDQGICEFDELSHEGCQGDFWGFSGGDHGLIFVFEVWVETGGDEGGHVEGIAKVFAPALNEGLATPFAGLACHGRKAGQAYAASLTH
jgi:hypothetical protein